MSDVFRYYRQEFYNDYEKAVELYPSDKGNNRMPSKEEAFMYYEYFATKGEMLQHFGRVVTGWNTNIKEGFTHQKYRQLEGKGQAFNPGSATDKDGVEFNGMKFHDEQFKYAWLKKHGWTAILNDLWLIANTHMKKQFNAVSPIEKSYIISDDEFCVSVFGRELCGLLMSGYSKVGTRTFMPMHSEGDHSARRLSLSDYVSKMNSMKKDGKSAFDQFFIGHRIF